MPKYCDQDCTVNHVLFIDGSKLYGRDDKKIDTLAEAPKFVTDDIGMCFGIDKCSILVSKRERIAI